MDKNIMFFHIRKCDEAHEIVVEFLKNSKITKVKMNELERKLFVLKTSLKNIAYNQNEND